MAAAAVPTNPFQDALNAFGKMVADAKQAMVDLEAEVAEAKSNDERERLLILYWDKMTAFAKLAAVQAKEGPGAKGIEEGLEQKIADIMKGKTQLDLSKIDPKQVTAVRAKIAGLSVEYNQFEQAFHAWKTPPFCPGCRAKPTNTVLRRCGTCLCAAYCSDACQKKHWPDHRDYCDLAARVLIIKCTGPCGELMHANKNLMWVKPLGSVMCCGKCRDPAVHTHRVVARSLAYQQSMNAGPACRCCGMKVAAEKYTLCKKCKRGVWCSRECRINDLVNHKQVCHETPFIWWAPPVT